MGGTFLPNVHFIVNQNAVKTKKTVIGIYPVLFIQVCAGKDEAREQKTVTLQQFVPCLYTVSSGRRLQCTDTNLIGCYTLCGICTNHITVLLLSTIFIAVMKFVKRRKFACNITLWRVRGIFLPATLS